LKKITVISSGSFGPSKKIIRDEISWIKSANAESKLFNFSETEIFGAACGSEHSLYKYAKFRSELIKATFIEGIALEKNKSNSFSTTSFVRRMKNQCPSIIYTLPNILRIICLLLKRNKYQKKFDNVKLILSGGEAWIPNLETLVKIFFPNAKIIEFYGAAELGFVGWGNPGEGYNLFPSVKAWCDDSRQIWVESPYIANIKSPATVGDTGWFDSKGLLHLAGRSDRKFRIKGIDVVPENIEMILRSHPQITNVYVFKKKFINGKSRIAVIISTDDFQGYYENIPSKLISPSNELSKILKNILSKAKINLSTNSIKKIKTWPLLKSGKTNFKLLESIW
tara:strand:+ start:596 stop:1609 length:1014 start_codon:yes stop_codon:yes gene_type:complete